MLTGRADGSFAVVDNHPLAAVTAVNAALWGDFDNDGRTDVYLCRRGPNQLWRHSADDGWEDVTDATARLAGDLDTVDGALFDADHDGDLDLFLVNGDGPNELLNNNLDGTFRPLAAERGLAGDRPDTRQVLPAGSRQRPRHRPDRLIGAPPHAVLPQRAALGLPRRRGPGCFIATRGRRVAGGRRRRRPAELYALARKAV